jgi:putative transposase
LKIIWIKHSREEARADVFDYIEFFYNSMRRHGYTNGLPPAQYERLYEKRLAGV